MSVDFKKIFGLYESEIFGYIKNSVVDAEVARDLCQDVFIQALIKSDELDPSRNVKNWLKTVARNRVINYFHEKQRRQFVELSETTIRTEIESGNFSTIIENVLKSLPQHHRDILWLREIEGFSYKELAEETGSSEAAVTSRIKRARINFSRIYLLHHLPDWFRKNAEDLSIEDIGRFINDFEPPVDLLDHIHRKSQRYFHSVRQTWSTIRKGFFPGEKLNAILGIIGESANCRILDLGCGSGVISTMNAVLGKNVIGIDINRAMLDELNQLKATLELVKLKLIRANINHLPLKNVFFEEIYLTLVLHHIPDPASVIRHAAKHLSGSGHLIIVEYERHTNRLIADTMHDIWLGFDPNLLNRWCQKQNLKMISTDVWETNENLRVFYQIYQKV